jgi:hypothetical protein
MVALIARAHLTPAASDAIDRLLRQSPIDPALSRNCKDRPGDPMADSATWADDQRSADRGTANWHFIDIPLAIHAGSVPREDAMKWCAVSPDGNPGCIVSALDFEWAVLRDTSQPAAARATALRYVIHFLGDLAQPLHVVDNHDQGGNCENVLFFGATQNLHSVWDTQLIARDLAASKATEIQYAGNLDQKFSSNWPGWGIAKIDFLGWAWESNELAESVAYGDLMPHLPVAPATAGEADRDACAIVREKSTAQQIAIGDDYFAQAMPVIREQLAKAAYRLAGMLNQTFQ